MPQLVTPVGRFAPSPTGPLHLGSLVAAAGSWLAARARGGRWLVRIEDVDRPREVPGAAREQLRMLAAFGLQPDGEVMYQSRREARYRQVLDELLRRRQAFACGCTRADLAPGGIYPGTCRDGLPEGRRARSIRLRVGDETITVHDAVQGEFAQSLRTEIGDFVIRRADGLFAYQLAVVVDDADSGINQVVRGCDLLDSTPRQIYLQQALGLAPPDYVHLPLIVDRAGRKLSKSGAADPVGRLPPEQALRHALRALGHEPPVHCRTLAHQWRWALAHWDLRRIPRGPVML